jgi:hypothetical protein
MIMTFKQVLRVSEDTATKLQQLLYRLGLTLDEQL